MRQLGLPDVDYSTPILNNNKGAIDQIDAGCKPTKKSITKTFSTYESMKQRNMMKCHSIGSQVKPIQLTYSPRKMMTNSTTANSEI